MLRNYLKIGLRNLLKNKLFSLINISGMAISIASFLIIALFIYDELKFDKHIEDHQLKYRIYNDYVYGDGRRINLAMIPPPIAPALMTEYPEVDYFARFMNFSNAQLFEYGEKKMTEPKGGYADSTIFKMFSLTLLEGDEHTALTEPNTVAINRTLKEKYFGDKPALGEVIQVFNQDFKVGAVFEDFPPHSHFQMNYFISMGFLNAAIPQRMESWGWSQFHTYIKLKPGTSGDKLESKLEDFARRNAWEETKGNGSYYIPHLMPMAKMHLHSADFVYEIAVRGNIQTVYILSATAIFILVIAILNFVNLSTARAVSRVKEVGVRKVAGAFRGQLIYQFISESVVIALIALVVGGLVTELILPQINAFTEKSIPTGIFLHPLAIVGLLTFAVVIGIAAGAYPAFYISSYRPAQILSNKQAGGSGKTLLRKGLVVLQFILSFFLIIAALVVSEQHAFMRNKDMGFDKENIIAVQLRGDMTNNLETTKQEFSNHPNVISSTIVYGLPGEAFAGDGITDIERKKELSTSLLVTDHDYVKTLGLDVIAGRDFSRDFASDEKHAFIISEAMVKLLGHTTPEEAIGHEVAWNTWRQSEDTVKTGKVIGVVRDFHLSSLHESISPVVIIIYPEGASSLTFKVKSGNLQETITHFEKTWKKFNSEWPFEYRFIDENFDKLYKSEEKLATLFRLFTGFTIFVACLGLFGLVVYNTTQRYKEISIRKVLGAAEGGLVLNLSKAFMMLILIAFVIAIPISYYAAESWLEKFPYRIGLTPLLFVKAGVLIMVIALATVGVQALRAARTNPVDALKEQ